MEWRSGKGKKKTAGEGDTPSVERDTAAAGCGRRGQRTKEERRPLKD
jgi:hypothetical protein